MTRTPSKFTLAAAALTAASLLATGHPEAQPAPKNPSQDSSSFSFSTVTQSRGRLGAKVITMSEDLRAFFGAPKDRGLLVDSVLPDTPAAKAGLESGDVIVGVSGEAISESWDIFKAMEGAKKGDSVKLEIVRDKKTRTLSATLESESAGPMQMHMPWGQGAGEFDFGLGGVDPKFFGKGFPFDHMPMNPSDMQEQMRRLEERLNRLEGNPGKTGPKKGTPKGSKDKPFRSAPGGSGNAS